MDLPVILVKISGVILLAFTIRSIIRHLKDRRRAIAEKRPDSQSKSEKFLNATLLYLWLAFMLALSGGMILNN